MYKYIYSSASPHFLPCTSLICIYYITCRIKLTSNRNCWGKYSMVWLAPVLRRQLEGILTADGVRSCVGLGTVWRGISHSYPLVLRDFVCWVSDMELLSPWGRWESNPLGCHCTTLAEAGGQLARRQIQSGNSASRRRRRQRRVCLWHL